MGGIPIANTKPVEDVVAKAKTRDRNYYYEKRAKEHQREISQELATRHLLSEGTSNATPANTARRMVPRVAFALITVLTVLLLHFLV